MGTAETIVSIIGGIVAIAVGVLTVWRLASRKPGPPEGANARGRSVASGAVVQAPVATGDGSIAVGRAGVVMGPGSILYQGVDEDSRQRLADVHSMLKQLQETLAVPPTGAAPVDTHALAAQATQDTERLLAEAIGLQNQGKDPEAIDCLLEAYRRDLVPEAKVELHLLAGHAFFGLSQFDQAQWHYRQSLEAAEQADVAMLEFSALGAMAAVYHQRFDMDAYWEYYERAVRKQMGVDMRLRQASHLCTLGDASADRGDFQQAEQHYRKAWEIHEEVGDRLGQVHVLGSLGLLAERRGDSTNARDLLHQAASLYEQMAERGEGPDRLREALRRLETPQPKRSRPKRKK